MAQRSRPGRPLQVYLEEETWERLSAVAKANKRAVAVEVREALERYLAAPDQIRPAVVLPSSEPPPEPAKRGRPKGSTKKKEAGQ